MYFAIITSLLLIQSGSQSSVNQEAVDPSLVSSSSVVQTLTTQFINPQNGLVDNVLPSSDTTPSCTPLPLELHIDEDGCSAPTSLAGSTVMIASSKSIQYSHIQQKDDGDSFNSEISHVESLTISNTLMQPSQTEVNSSTQVSVTKVSTSKSSSPFGKSLSPITIGRSSSPDSTARSFSPVVISKSPSPVNVCPTLRAKSPSPPDIKCSSPVPKSYSPVPISHSPKATAKNESPMTVLSTTEMVPKTASPVTVPGLSSPVSNSVSPVTVPKTSSPLTIPKSPSPETVPKSSSPLPIPRLSSPVPKTASPFTVPNISCSTTEPKIFSPETVPMDAYQVIHPRLSSPPNSPASVVRKMYTVPDSHSPRASPVSLAALPSSSQPSPLTEKQGGEALGLSWPCREPLLDDALEKLLAPDSTQLDENQSPASIMPGDEDRPWEEEDGIYPDLSREGTLTPMTESSWMDECFTPSTCPGTPDAMLDLPTQQPSAVERLSASGQVRHST